MDRLGFIHSTVGAAGIADNLTIDSSVNDRFNTLYSEKLKKYDMIKKKSRYDSNLCFIIQIVYVIAIIGWIVLFYFTRLFENIDWVVSILGLIPLLVFLIGFSMCSYLTYDVEETVLNANFLSFAFLIVVVINNWNEPQKAHDRHKFVVLMVTAFILIMLSMIDVWLPHRELTVLLHIRTILQTAALIILSITLYLYFKHLPSRVTAPIVSGVGVAPK